MGLFDKSIFQDLGKSLGEVVEAAKEVASEATKAVNDSETFASIKGAVEGFVGEAAKNMKICPACGEPSPADSKFCLQCGEALPEMTMADSAVCPNCGKENKLGTKFCQECGTKLPIAVMEEEMEARKDQKEMEKWPQLLPQYPVWECGGSEFSLDQFDNFFSFTAYFGNQQDGMAAIAQYRQVLMEGGFRPNAENPTTSHLYKTIDGVTYHVDTEHCFEGGDEQVSIGFAAE